MKKILVVALSVALLLSTTACGTNSELEAKKQKNEQLKQTIDELKKDLAQQTSSPQSTDAPKQSDYLDESQNYTNNNINNAPFMNIYENWTKNKQLGIN